ncbi:DNA adenine methylase [Klebsiella sp. T2.Ur]|nr:DNA adenine methylase [Klebsiella sp. T2.Ur]
MSTILKWAGNKTAIMSELKKHLPDGPRLVEPFAGSCAVMMATDYPHYLVADINADLINLYKKAAYHPEELIQVAMVLFSEDTSLTTLELAALFLYLNRHCYRGLCRYNQRGKFNVPYGNYKNPYFPHAEILTFAEKAVRATFICASYGETLAILQAGDVVYCDPPYDGTFSGYHTAGFSDDDQYDLASILVRRSSEGHPIVVSNSDTRLIRSFYRNFAIHRISTKRSIGVAAGGGKKADELIAVIKPKVCVGVDLAGGRDYSVVREVRV